MGKVIAFYIFGVLAVLVGSGWTFVGPTLIYPSHPVNYPTIWVLADRPVRYWLRVFGCGISPIATTMLPIG